ncbi:MAG TPA: hypothetical protein VNO55_27585, partial [Polyangia bacterium]|nr:hypothetical protein [Polyangia bacterium]
MVEVTGMARDRGGEWKKQNSTRTPEAIVLAFLLAFFVCALASPPVARAGQSSSRCATGTEVLRLGFTTFESATNLSTDQSWYRSLETYLRRVANESARSAGFECPVEFDIHLGNYYQVMAWFREGEIDAAVVSAFVAYVLQNEAGAVPVVQFREHDADVDSTSYEPLVAARVPAEPKRQPGQEFDDFLCLALAAAEQKVGLPARTDCPAGRQAGHYQLNADAHPSTSTFVTPMLYARGVADAYLAQARQQLAPARRTSLLDAYWAEVLQSVRFSFSQRPDPSLDEGRPRQLFFSYT